MPGHGGDLRAALTDAGIADASGWHDLSTGINPHPYPLPAIGEDVWRRLPGVAELAALNDAARACYGVAADGAIATAAGTELLISMLPSLFSARHVSVISPTYASHAPAWRRAGHEVREVLSMDAADGDVVVLTNPNNPDGRVTSPTALAASAQELTARDGWLVVDEAFADAVPEISVVGLAAQGNTVVLRSFGKFFGLAGLRLGFAIAPPAMTRMIEARLGDWPVSGPAAVIGAAALADIAWQQDMHARLVREAAALDDVLAAAGLNVVGGTPLFRFIDDPRAAALYEALWARQIYARRFADRPAWLRIGLPPDGAAISNVSQALADVAGGKT